MPRGSVNVFYAEIVRLRKPKFVVYISPYNDINFVKIMRILVCFSVKQYKELHGIRKQLKVEAQRLRGGLCAK